MNTKISTSENRMTTSVESRHEGAFQGIIANKKQLCSLWVIGNKI